MSLASITAIALLKAIPETFRSYGISHVVFDGKDNIQFACSESEASELAGGKLDGSIWTLQELIEEIEHQSEEVPA